MLPMVVDRNGERLTLSIRPKVIEEDGHQIGDLGFSPDLGVQTVVVDKTLPGSPAEETGLKSGDRIVALDGGPARNTARYASTSARTRSRFASRSSAMGSASS